MKMPTNTIKHRMISAAKKIANTEFESKRITTRGLDGSINGETWYPSTYFREEAIKFVLDNHPEYDSGEFRRMIKEFEVRNKQSEDK